MGLGNSWSCQDKQIFKSTITKRIKCEDMSHENKQRNRRFSEQKQWNLLHVSLLRMTSNLLTSAYWYLSVLPLVNAQNLGFQPSAGGLLVFHHQQRYRHHHFKQHQNSKLGRIIWAMYYESLTWIDSLTKLPFWIFLGNQYKILMRVTTDNIRSIVWFCETPIGSMLFFGPGLKKQNAGLQRCKGCLNVVFVTADLGKKLFEKKKSLIHMFLLINNSRCFCLWFETNKRLVDGPTRMLFYGGALYFNMSTLFWAVWRAMTGKNHSLFCILGMLKEGKMAKIQTNHHLIDKLAAKNQEENDNHNKNSAKHPRDRLKLSEGRSESSGKPSELDIT